MNGYNEVLERELNTTAAPACASGDRELKSTRIWMVDDNASFRRLLADLLGDESGFECERQFSSPPEVMAALSREAAPDIILLDVEMGEHNGLDAVRPIKALAPEAHVLMLTTFSGPGCRERAFREGASDFMLKSWRIPEITAHIRQAMEFGSVAGLMTAFLSGERPMVVTPKRPEVKPDARTRESEGWLAQLRGLLRLTPSLK